LTVTIQAHLHRLHLQSPQPERLVDFYVHTYGMRKGQVPGLAAGQQAVASAFSAMAPGRQVMASNGAANQLHYFLYSLETQAAWASFVQRTAQVPKADVSAFAELPAHALAFRDPDGHCVVFASADVVDASGIDTDVLQAASNAKALPPAITQHLGIRTPNIDAMATFYSEFLGFVVSDRVHDDQGQLRACFLRTSELHHALALFGAPVSCFDHQSFEAPDWEGLKHWADHMGDLRQEIVWGVGRHGPGNDVFFMVRDPDGNLAEISSEIEVCTPDRPLGIWKHEERTLNLWGKAIMRS
jgi:catechol 2,3-dioxygenase-like lactoylglutathione lyase family enzyme